MSVSWGERGIEREWDGERANQKKSCNRQSADRARITCRGCDDKESEQKEGEEGCGGGADRDAKSFRDRDAVAFNGLYVICELGVGVAHQSQEIESVAVPVACCMLSM